MRCESDICYSVSMGGVGGEIACCRTYADGAAAQTRPNEAAEVGIGSVETDPTLWLVLFLFVGDHCRRGLLRHSHRN